jgi:hypothetical protein
MNAHKRRKYYRMSSEVLEVEIDEVDDIMNDIRQESKKVHVVDRKRENELVLEYLNTESPDALKEVHDGRIPNLRYLANKFRWFHKDYDDVYGEFLVVFMNSVNKYKNGTDFNTFFYTNALNHIKNMIKWKYRKKRTLENGASFESMSTSLDEYGTDGSTSGRLASFHDLIAGPCVSPSLSAEMLDIVEAMSDESKLMSDGLLIFSTCKKREFTKDNQVFLYTCDSESGDPIQDAHNDLKAPCDFYQITECDVFDGVISYEVELDTKEFYKYVIKLAKEKFIN